MASGNSYNGWPANSDPNAIGIDTQWGKKVGAPAFGSGGYPGGVKSGDVSTLFVYLVNSLQPIEPMMKGSNGENGYGCWGYSYRANVNNPSSLSCHASGTAIDYNAPKHPNGTSTGPNGGGGWTGSQYNAIKSILNGPLQGAISWLTGNDPMHFEIQGSASKIASVAASLGGTTPPVPGPDPTPTPTPVEDDDDVMQLLRIKNGDGKIYAASVGGKRFFWVDNPDNLYSNQLAHTYSQNIIELDQGQMNHVRYSCTMQAELPNTTPIP